MVKESLNSFTVEAISTPLPIAYKWDEFEHGAHRSAQSLLRTLRGAGYPPSPELLNIVKDPTNWEYWEDIVDTAATTMGADIDWEDEGKKLTVKPYRPDPIVEPYPGYNKKPGILKRLRKKLGYGLTPIAYKHEKKKIAAGAVAGGITVQRLLARRQLKPIDRVSRQVQKSIGIAKPAKLKPLPLGLGTTLGGHATERRILIQTPRQMQRSARLAKRIGPSKSSKVLTGRHVLAHEIAHNIPAADISPRKQKQLVHLTAGIQGKSLRNKMRRLGRIFTVTHGRLHGPRHKSVRRHIEKVMKRGGAWKKLRKLGYGLAPEYDPKNVRATWSELKQHGVSPKTRMQWLSRVYGGRGGYSSEELYKIVTGKSKDRYYIFPFVKGAPPEVNRILEATYRKHRGQLAAKVTAGEMTEREAKKASAIASWNKVKQAGYTRKQKPATTWVKRKGYGMSLKMKVIKTATQHPVALGTLVASPAIIAVIRKKLADLERERAKQNYAVFDKTIPLRRKRHKLRRKLHGQMGKKGLLRRGTRNLWHTGMKHPGLVKGLGAAGVGYLVAKRMQRRKKKKYQWMIDPSAGRKATPGFWSKAGKKTLAGGKVVGKQAAMTAAAALLWLYISKLIERAARKPYMPDIRPDIELQRGYELITQYAGQMPVDLLQLLKAKTKAGMRGMKRGVQRNMFAWLLGFITAELLARGFTKKQHKVHFSAPLCYAPEKDITKKEASGWGLKKGKSMESHLRAQHLANAKLDKDVVKIVRMKKGELKLALAKAKLTAKHSKKIARRAVWRHRVGMLGKGLGIAAGVAIPLATWRSLQERGEGYARPGSAAMKLAKKEWKQRKAVAGLAKKDLRLLQKRFGRRPIRWTLKKGFPVVAGATLPLIALRALQLKRQKQKQYSVGSALKATWRLTKKGLGKESLLRRKVTPKIRGAGNIALTGWIVSDIIPRKKKRPLQQQPYYPPQGYELVEMYPFQSKAQRRWMHANKPEMAEEWEEKTPKGKKLPEKVAKKYAVAFLGKARRSPLWKKFVTKATSPGIKERLLFGPPKMSKGAAEKLAKKLSPKGASLIIDSGLGSRAYPEMKWGTSGRYPAAIAHEATHLKQPASSVIRTISETTGGIGATVLGAKRGFRRKEEKKPSIKKIAAWGGAGFVPTLLSEAHANIASRKYPGARRFIPLSMGTHTARASSQVAQSGTLGWLLGRGARTLRKKLPEKVAKHSLPLKLRRMVRPRFNPKEKELLEWLVRKSRRFGELSRMRGIEEQLKGARRGLQHEFAGKVKKLRQVLLKQKHGKRLLVGAAGAGMVGAGLVGKKLEKERIKKAIG